MREKTEERLRVREAAFRGSGPGLPPGAVRVGRDGRESRRRAGSGA